MNDPRLPSGSIAGSGNGGGTNSSLSLDNPLRNVNENHHHDPKDMARIKDGITLSPEEENGLMQDADSDQEYIRLDIKCPSLNDSAGSKILSVPVSTTIAQLKQDIQSSWTGKPKASGMRFFKAGQTLSDEVIIGQIVKESERVEPAPVHLVIRPDAWTETRKVQSKLSNVTRKNMSISAASPTSAIHPTKTFSSSLSQRSLLSGTLPSSDTTDDRNLTYENDGHLPVLLSNMDLSQLMIFRSLLSWIYARYFHIYETEWEAVYGEPRENPKAEMELNKDLGELVEVMGCSMDEVDMVIDQIEKDVFLWGPITDSIAKHDIQNPYRYKRISYNGLPYLLRVEKSVQTEKLRAIHKRIEHIRFVHHQLDKVINYQSLMDQALPMSQAMEAQGIHPLRPFLNDAQARGLPPTNRRMMFFNRFSGLQRQDLFSVLFSTLFLSLKVGLLVYVLTRGASATKQFYMISVALLYVLYEAWRMLLKKAHARRRANRRATGVPNGAQNEQAGQRQNRQPHRQGATNDPDGPARPAGQQNPNEVPAPAAPVRYTVFSPFLLDFWIERIAYFRLHEEDREIGLELAPGQRRANAAAHHDTIRKLFDFFSYYILLPSILFISTLIPEIEQRRRRAIDQREELIRSTARKVEEQERRLREEQEKRSGEDEKVSQSSNEKNEIATSIQIRQPALLTTPYAQRILDQSRSEGRQIDIAQELEAAAVAAAREENEGGFEQADMGFL